MEARTVQSLIVDFRKDVDDYTDAYENNVGDDSNALWLDSEVLRYVNSAVDALARATFGLNEVARIGFAAGATFVTLPKHILDIHSARLVTANRAVVQRNVGQVGTTAVNDYGIQHTEAPAMFDTALGVPREFVREYDANKLRFIPGALDADTLELQCSVTISRSLTATDNVPFTELVDIELLITYMRHLAYRKHKAETEDLVRSKSNKQDFDTQADYRRCELARQRSVPGMIRMEGW
jgi:hypothetical protein